MLLRGGMEKRSLLFALVLAVLLALVPFLHFPYDLPLNLGYVLLAIGFASFMIIGICLVELTRRAWQAGGWELLALVAVVSSIVASLLALEGPTRGSYQGLMYPQFFATTSLSYLTIVVGTMMLLYVHRGELNPGPLSYSAMAAFLVGLMTVFFLDGANIRDELILLVAFCFAMVSISFYSSSVISRRSAAPTRSRIWMLGRVAWAVVYSIFATIIIYLPAYITMEVS